MNKTNLKKKALYVVLTAATVMLAACGGGSSSTAAPSTPTPTPATTQTATSADVATPQYAATSAQLAIFNTINADRQQCGFPALTENTTLDTSAQNHAIYMIDNAFAATDTEVSGNPGFTGITYVDRAVAVGYPSSATTAGTFGGSAGGSGPLTPAQFGLDVEANAWVSGIYHTGVIFNSGSIVGIGEDEASANGTTNSNAAIFVVHDTATLANAPLTFPCQGVTGVPFDGLAESPTAPNVSASGWGTPILVEGNLTDTIVLATGTITGPSGVTNLQLLDSANDPNHVLQSFNAVAYPSSPLQANTTYTVSITGTDNGTAFSRNFSFTTGSSQG